MPAASTVAAKAWPRELCQFNKNLCCGHCFFFHVNFNAVGQNASPSTATLSDFATALVSALHDKVNAIYECNDVETAAQTIVKVSYAAAVEFARIGLEFGEKRLMRVDLLAW